jgi:hypothetical protein
MKMILPVKEISPPPQNQSLMYIVGLSALILNKI